MHYIVVTGIYLLLVIWVRDRVKINVEGLTGLK